MSAYNYRTDSLASFIKPIAIMAVFQVIFLRQPDFGAAISLGIITLAMLFFSGMKLRYLLSIAVFALPAAV
jgi:cell division protein FtsW